MGDQQASADRGANEEYEQDNAEPAPTSCVGELPQNRAVRERGSAFSVYDQLLSIRCASIGQMMAEEKGSEDEFGSQCRRAAEVGRPTQVVVRLRRW